KINDIKIMQLGGSGSGGMNFNGDGSGSGGGGNGGGGSPTDEVINSALRYRVQAPMVDSLLNDIGIEGSNIAKSDIIRTANDMARAGNEMKRLKSGNNDQGKSSSDGKEKK
ncbi:MAG: flotillin domain-containing protein, partial [Pseudomonadota bacterium]